MLQALDLARENTLLKGEVSRLRADLAQLARELVAQQTLSGQSPPAKEASPVTLVVPRSRTRDYAVVAARFAAVPSCAVVVDRRTVQRRRGQTRPVVERRQSERRCGDDAAVALVVSVGRDR